MGAKSKTKLAQPCLTVDLFHTPPHPRARNTISVYGLPYSPPPPLQRRCLSFKLKVTLSIVSCPPACPGDRAIRGTVVGCFWLGLPSMFLPAQCINILDFDFALTFCMCMIKIFWGGGVVTPSKPLPFTHPCFKMFLERSLNDPHHPTSSTFHCYPLTIHHPPKNLDHTLLCLDSLHHVLTNCIRPWHFALRLDSLLCVLTVCITPWHFELRTRLCNFDMK